MELKLKTLAKIYHDPKSPAGFVGQERLYKEESKLIPQLQKRM
jgi:hypothetical protein